MKIKSVVAVWPNSNIQGHGKSHFVIPLRETVTITLYLVLQSFSPHKNEVQKCRPVFYSCSDKPDCKIHHIVVYYQIQQRSSCSKSHDGVGMTKRKELNTVTTASCNF